MGHELGGGKSNKSQGFDETLKDMTTYTLPENVYTKMYFYSFGGSTTHMAKVFTPKVKQLLSADGLPIEIGGMVKTYEKGTVIKTTKLQNGYVINTLASILYGRKRFITRLTYGQSQVSYDSVSSSTLPKALYVHTHFIGKTVHFASQFENTVLSELLAAKEENSKASADQILDKFTAVVAKYVAKEVDEAVKQMIIPSEATLPEPTPDKGVIDYDNVTYDDENADDSEEIAPF